MKKRRDVLWVVEILDFGGEYIPLIQKVKVSRRDAQWCKKGAEAAYPYGTKFRVAKYVREGEGQ